MCPLVALLPLRAPLLCLPLHHLLSRMPWGRMAVLQWGLAVLEWSRGRIWAQSEVLVRLAHGRQQGQQRQQHRWLLLVIQLVSRRQAVEGQVVVVLE